MMDVTLWLAFTIATIIVLVVPGPTVLVVMNCVLQQGKKSIPPAILGVAMGDIIAMALSLIGVGGLMFILVDLFAIIKWLGAVYLAYLGVMMIKNAPYQPQKNDIVPYQKLFTQNFLVTVLNPKSIAFFIAFLPQFIVQTQPLIPQFAVMMVTFVVLGSLNAYLYALFAHILKEKLNKPRLMMWILRISGGFLCLLGASLLGYQIDIEY